MAMFGLLEVLMVLLTGGGGNELLDYMPTDAYWRSKGVEVTVERMVGELAVGEPAAVPQLVRDLGADAFATREAAMKKLRAIGPAAAPALKRAAESDDPEVKMRARELLEGLAAGGTAQAKAVRRLMAIRALGQLKKPEALPALRKLLGAKELFVADYAQAAVAAIEGKLHERPTPTKAMLAKDLCLLPAGCGIVARSTMPRGGPVAFRKLLDEAAPALRPGMDREQMLAQLVGMLSKVSDRVGNVRLDAVTVGVASDIGDRQGYVVVVARGLYDAAAVRAALGQLGVASTKVEGMEVFAAGGELRLIPCSNERLVVAIAPPGAQSPAGELVAALKRDGERPALDAKMQALLKSIDTTAPMWAAARLSDSYRQVPLFAPFDTAVIASKQAKDGALALTLVARGKDAAAVKVSVDQFEKGLAEGKAELAQEAGRQAFLKPVAEFLDSIAVRTEGATVTITGTLKGQSAALMMPMFMFLGVARSAPRPPPPPVVEGAQPR